LFAALGFALIAGTVIAAPVGASTPIGGCSGTCGSWDVLDDSPPPPYGAICKYETASYDLDSINVRPPRMNGPYSYKTRVEWRFRVLRSTNSGSSYSLYYTSAWQGAMASDTDAANLGAGFTRKTWVAPDPNPKGFFKVRLLLRWKNSGGSVIGNAKVELDNYQGKWNGNTDTRSDYCIQDW
jgi:hypothetical protein